MDQEIQEGIGDANPTLESGEQGVSMPDTEEQPASDQGNDGDLPEDVSDRTKEQFAKLKKHNLEMAAKLKEYERKDVGESVFDVLSGQVPGAGQQQPNVVQTPNLSKGQVNQIAQQFVDQFGNVDIDRLNQALVAANRKADDADRRARDLEQRVLKRDEARQVAEAHAKFPWLDPKSDQFDRKGFNLVRDRIVRNMVEGQEKTLSEIAEEFDSLIKPRVNVEVEKERAVEDFKKAQTIKSQAGSVVKGKGQPRETTGDYEDLRARTRMGDPNALSERLRQVTTNK